VKPTVDYSRIGEIVVNIPPPDPKLQELVAQRIREALRDAVVRETLYGGRLYYGPAEPVLTLKKCDRCRAYVSAAEHECVPMLEPAE